MTPTVRQALVERLEALKHFFDYSADGNAFAPARPNQQPWAAHRQTVRDALALLRADEADHWQPIESAPEDGTLVILASEGFIGYGRVGYDKTWWRCSHWSGKFVRANGPLKWVPLPKGGDAHEPGEEKAVARPDTTPAPSRPAGGAARCSVEHRIVGQCQLSEGHEGKHHVDDKWGSVEWPRERKD